MAPESMVHALEKIHGLLRPSGSLIHIQPTGEPPSIEVHSASRVDRAGWMGHRGDFAMYRQARSAVAQCVEDGLFVVERESTFPFLYHADTWHDLQAWLAEEWKRATVDEPTSQRAQELLRAAGDDGEVIVRERVIIARLSPR